VAVVGVPKTIDNDVRHCDATFGFQTAVEEATRSIAAAHAEAEAHRNGIGLVKLMGREAGFIAAHAVLACPDANFCLIPEIAFRLEGAGGLLDAIARRLDDRGHAVVVVAEGAGADLLAGREGRDESGNVRPADVGGWLSQRVREHFAAAGRSITLKYIDPSYAIRSRGANAADAILCGHLAKMAVHAALAGKTGLVIGQAHGLFVHVPLVAATSGRRRLKPDGLLWQSVLATTGQPDLA
jgi:6-phosphofructokinase 1